MKTMKAVSSKRKPSRTIKVLAPARRGLPVPASRVHRNKRCVARVNQRIEE